MGSHLPGYLGSSHWPTDPTTTDVELHWTNAAPFIAHHIFTTDVDFYREKQPSTTPPTTTPPQRVCSYSGQIITIHHTISHHATTTDVVLHRTKYQPNATSSPTCHHKNGRGVTPPHHCPTLLPTTDVEVYRTNHHYITPPTATQPMCSHH